MCGRCRKGEVARSKRRCRFKSRQRSQKRGPLSINAVFRSILGKNAVYTEGVPFLTKNEQAVMTCSFFHSEEDI
jgi:hypothetical protein